MICCVCGVLVVPMHDECWQRTSTALQMAASAGYGLVAVGRLFALLSLDRLPLGIERLYVCAAVVLFSACGGVSLYSAAIGDSAWGPTEEKWEAREVARAALALFNALVLAADAATLHVPAFPPPEPDEEAPTMHDSPPPYAFAISDRAGRLPPQ